MCLSKTVKLLTITNAKAYYAMKFITAVKVFFDVSPRPKIFQVIPSGLLVYIRLGWQGLPGISTLDLNKHL